MHESTVQCQTQIADLSRGLCSPSPGRFVTAGCDRGDGALDEPELAFRRGPEGPEVARFDAVRFELHAGARHLERVLVVPSIRRRDKAETPEGLDKRCTRA